MAVVRVEADVRATESLPKVKLACLSLFPDLVFEEEAGRLVGVGRDLARFRDLVRNQQIRDSAREVLIRGRAGAATVIRLNKQAAYAGRLNFSVGSPLGDLLVTIEDEDLDARIDEIAESTVGKRLKGTKTRTEDT